MKKGNGTLKWTLVGALSATLMASVLYLRVPDNIIIESKNVSAKSGDYSRTLYSVPELKLKHYKLDEDKYFKYMVSGVVDIGRDDPAKYPLWYEDYLKEQKIAKEKEELAKKLEELKKSIDSSVGNNNNNPIETGTSLEQKLSYVTEGMTYDDTVKILGDQGKEISKTGSASNDNTVYQWIDENKFTVVVLFINGKIFSKNSLELISTNNTASLENYNKVKSGITYEELKKFMGSEGLLLIDATTLNSKLKVYQWTNNNKTATVSFSFDGSDKLISMTQDGLE